MGDTYLPNDLYFSSIKNLFEFNNHSLVQFYHRNLAYLIFLYILILSFIFLKRKISKLYSTLNILLIFLFLQVFLGILTLVSGLNIYLASAHQITSVF